MRKLCRRRRQRKERLARCKLSAREAVSRREHFNGSPNMTHPLRNFLSALAVASAALALMAPAAHAQDKKTPQQEKMASCNKEAGDKTLKGDERKAFMSNCLKAKPEPVTQQDRMKSCNKEAGDKTLKGDERKAFMSKCLSNKG